MIRTPTTFVIGAGASRPYHLPTGRELHASAIRLRSNRDPHQLLLRTLAKGGIADEGELYRVLDELKAHPARSIDAYLESRQGHPKLPGHRSRTVHLYR